MEKSRGHSTENISEITYGGGELYGHILASYVMMSLTKETKKAVAVIAVTS
jgi:hypothetical protein